LTRNKKNEQKQKQISSRREEGEREEVENALAQKKRKDALE